MTALKKIPAKISAVFVCLAVTMVWAVSPFSGAQASAVTFSPNFTISSEAAVMINLDKDVVIYEKNADKKMYPASLTKIVTAMVVLDNIEDIDNTSFEAPLVVFDELYGQNPSTVGLSRGEITTVTDLLYSLMLKSACESAGILAYHVGGQSISNFVDMMNEKIKVIGCTGTHFVNPHGLYDDNQYTNARDMAKILKYAVENYPKLTEIATTPDYEMKPTNYSGEGWAHIYHTNSMLNRSSSYYYQYAKGYKTGTLDESGRNLATLGSRDGNNYMLVTLGSPQYDEEGNAIYLQYEDHKQLYEWAFDNFEFTQLVQAGKEASELQVRFGENSDFVRLVTAESYSCMWLSTIDTSRLKEKITIDESQLNEDGTITAPVTKGQILGKYTLTLAGEEICTVDLAAQTDVSMSQLSYSIDKAKQFVSSKWFVAAAAAAAALIVIYTVVFASIKSKKKRRMKNVRRKRKL
ncbi:MAG: D-alanyl-D-alanine carboxypeptidase [Oscillospiraceae bacterium]|nr:D-alanyl-D-alanine carboxypeptidase [Oscillospiraceae bacterium]